MNELEQNKELHTDFHALLRSFEFNDTGCQLMRCTLTRQVMYLRRKYEKKDVKNDRWQQRQISANQYKPHSDVLMESVRKHTIG